VFVSGGSLAAQGLWKVGELGRQCRPHEAAVIPLHVDEARERGGETQLRGVAGVDAGKEWFDNPGVGLGAQAACEELGHGLFAGRRTGPAAIAVVSAAAPGDDDVADQAGRSGR
jgi:hypothetical protein